MNASLLTELTAGNWVDIGCVLVALTAIGFGAYRGLSGELPLGTGWLVGVLAGWYVYAPAQAFYGRLDFLAAHPRAVTAATVVTAVLLAWGVAMLVRIGLSRAMKAVAKQPIDHILGTVAGLVRAALLVLFATGIMLLVPWRRGHIVFCHESYAGRLFVPVATELLVTAKTFFPRLQVDRAPDPSQAERTLVPTARPRVDERTIHLSWHPGATNEAPRPAP